MKEIVFEIYFESSVVLNSTSNTEGKVDSLDFIPGSNFLGMVAKNYTDFSDPFKVFHSGDVRFSDAMPYKNDKYFYKIPLSYFFKKNKEERGYYNHHILKDDDFTKFDQLKQKRSGFLNLDNEIFDVEYEYNQKSAREDGRSKEGSMFGYRALKAGTLWRFSVYLSDEVLQKDEELIIKTLLASKRLGKSKSAEYGSVCIKKIDKNFNKTNKFDSNDSKELSYIYAKSRIALIDENGCPTYDLKYLCKGLKDDNICYDKTQIKISSFTPFNVKRQTKDYERVCINKGSVIVLKNLNNDQKEELLNGIGAYLSEGFGEILINPEFLNVGEYGKSIKLEKLNDFKKESNNKAITSELAKFLSQKRNKRYKDLDIANSVSEFIKKHKYEFNESMNSQWGQIRSICQTSTDENICENIKNFTDHGVSKSKWDKLDRINILLRAIQKQEEKLKFTRFLSMKMPQQTGDKK